MYSPFIPNGREEIYAIGILAGFNNDLLTSTHLLIPQLENSFRYIIDQKGGISSTLSQNGIQQEKNLEQIFDDDIILNTFTTETIFTLKSLLISKHGHNLRNELSHGLLDHDSFYSVPAMYIWWITLRLCLLPLIAQKIKHQSEQTNS